MAAAAPVCATWIPEDDLLLKNAVEAGASLEALAKGAVKFSRRFTYKELRDRWHSLLYDPNIAAQASAVMFELEISGFSPSSKSIRSENFKGQREIPQKRKCGNIRKQYYAMRKKFRSEFYSSSDLGFLDEPSLNDCHGHGTDFREHVRFDREPQDGNFIPDNLGLQEADLDILRNVFPETIQDYTLSSVLGDTKNIIPVECPNPIDDNYLNGILNKYEYPSDVSTSLRQDVNGSSVPNVKCLEISCTFNDNMPNFGESFAIKESSSVQVPPCKRFFKSSEKKQLSSFDPGDDNPQNVCFGFGGSQHFNSPNSEGISSLQAIGYPSPQSNLPLWKTMEDFSAPSMPIGMSDQDTTRDAEIMLPNDIDKARSSEIFYIVHSGPFLGVEQNSTDLINSSTVSDGDYVDLPDSLLNLSNEDEIEFMDVDGEEATDRNSYDDLTSVLQNSPEVAQEEHFAEVEPEKLMVGEICIVTPDIVDPIKKEINSSSPHSDRQIFCCVEDNVPSTSGISAESRELVFGYTYCTLNTEDPEIPCNDDIFLLIHPSTVFASSAAQPFTRDSLDASGNVKVSEQEPNLSNKGKDSSRSLPWPQNVGTSTLIETLLCDPLPAKAELPDTNLPGKLSRGDSKVPGDLIHSKSSDAILKVSTGRLPENGVTGAQLRSGDGSASLAEIPQYAEAGPPKIDVPEPTSSVSDPDGPPIEDDVPYSSDVEAMILEMDLDPPDEEYSISRQVPRYQYEETKSTIIRLEQCARSCLQRTMTSKGAFAILYGCHTKHYIRKTEVILGRSTDDNDIDIDLRKEGRANKISRRQALIKIEADGSFSLKNIGKSATFVNGKSVATGQSLILSSSCLIKIRDMSFVFEINQKYVRHYLDVTARKSTENNNKFNWSPEGVP